MNTFKFKPAHSPEIKLKIGDHFSFQWSGKDEDGEFIMYNNYGAFIEKDGSPKIEWNGGYYNPSTFLYCEHLDGDISMDAIKII